MYLFSLCQPRFFSKNVVAVVNLGSSGVVVSCGCVFCLNLQPDEQVKMNIASLNGVEKKTKSVFLTFLLRSDTLW